MVVMMSNFQIKIKNKKTKKIETFNAIDNRSHYVYSRESDRRKFPELFTETELLEIGEKV